MGLYDTGASVSFVDAGFVSCHGIPVHQDPPPEGDERGWTQGQVSLFLSIGESFQEKVTLVIINLDQFDFVIGLPDIMGFRMELRSDPMRISYYKTVRLAVMLP